VSEQAVSEQAVSEQAVAPLRRDGSLDPDALAVLEGQRDFLLRSLDDLDREREAGDVDERDYQTLRDDYTARAAAVIRAIEEGFARAAEARPPRSLTRTLAWSVAATAFAVLAGVLVAQSAGHRDSEEFITGDMRRSVTQNLNRAGQALAEGRLEDAIRIYGKVLEDQPANAEALAYRGWALTLSGDREQGLLTLIEAATKNPDYPDSRAFLAIVFFRAGLLDEAARELELLEGLNPPAPIRELMAGLRPRIEAARAAEAPGAAPAPAPQGGGGR
jgi:tetratricopeptide (TPR) repeat protein